MSVNPVTFFSTAIVGVDGSERSRDALSLAAALSGPDGRLLVSYVHPYGELSSLLGEGDYEQLVRETAESIFEDVREVVGDATRNELRLVSDRSPATWDVIGCGFNGSAESRAALAVGEKLAAELGASLRVLGVHQPLAFAGVSTAGTFGFESAGETLRGVQQQQLEDAASSLDERVRASIRLLDGNSTATLIEQSEHLDLLIVGSRGYGPVRSVVLGSVSRALSREAACPLIVVPRPGEAP
jgi:nucleotide-binding universal stress UspA family protein